MKSEKIETSKFDFKSEDVGIYSSICPKDKHTEIPSQCLSDKKHEMTAFITTPKEALNLMKKHSQITEKKNNYANDNDTNFLWKS